MYNRYKDLLETINWFNWRTGELEKIEKLSRYAKEFELIPADKTALMLAACQKNGGGVDIAPILIKAGFNLDTQNAISGQTALMIALESYYDTDMAPLLIDAGADLSLRDTDGRTALMYAAKNVTHSNTAVKILGMMLKDANIDVNARDKDGSTALTLAAEHGDAEVLDLLIAGKANVNICDHDGENALIITLKSYNHKEAVQTLVNAGTHPDVKNSAGDAAIHLTSRSCWPDILKILLDGDKNGKNKSDPNIRDDNGMTPLMHAAKNTDAESVAILLAAGANIALTDATGKTALDWARRTALLEIAKNTDLLLDLATSRTELARRHSPAVRLLEDALLEKIASARRMSEGTTEKKAVDLPPVALPKKPWKKPPAPGQGG